MARFADTDPIPKRLPPVYGYLTHELVPLQKAVEPILPQVDQLDRFAKIAKDECHFPSEHGLTRDESAAIFLYTMEWGGNSFYQVINRALRSEDRLALKTWFAYLKLFDTAIKKLPTVQGNIWRGATRDVSRSFKKDEKFTWWSITSCSTLVNVAKKFLKPSSTLFLIEANNGKDISTYANYPTENEVILFPGTRLRVLSDPFDQSPFDIVHLREENDNTPEQLSRCIKAGRATTLSEIGSSQTTGNSETSFLKAYTDKDSHQYNLLVHISH
jgi:hypothetical protein